MKICLIGYGKMGREIENILLEKGVIVEKIYDENHPLSENEKHDCVCIDFTSPDAFNKNYKLIADSFSGAVVGTTGWNENKDEIINHFKERNKSLIYGSNFSIGVNIFFEFVNNASKLFLNFPEYKIEISEIHHVEKKDAPSGTAKSISEIVKDVTGKEIEIASERIGDVKGIHDIDFISQVDKISLKHEAFSRRGFALGAIMAAEWLEDVKGVWEFKDLFKEKYKI
ncbi:MAG TPA: 4-hydroxy-tetrahydrodipicolinate reductase [Ignavibacteria bacterium]|nr:4-hydroxy-tetrahydrodipicolinate reductase [Ignavibacteria bacterium]